MFVGVNMLSMLLMVEYFKAKAGERGYQTLMYGVQGIRRRQALADTLRRVIREELQRTAVFPEVTESAPPIPRGQWTAQRRAGNEQSSPAGRSWASAQAVSQRRRPWVWPDASACAFGCWKPQKASKAMLYRETLSLHARKRAYTATAA